MAVNVRPDNLPEGYSIKANAAADNGLDFVLYYKGTPVDADLRSLRIDADNINDDEILQLRVNYLVNLVITKFNPARQAREAVEARAREINEQ